MCELQILQIKALQIWQLKSAGHENKSENNQTNKLPLNELELFDVSQKNYSVMDLPAE